MAQRPIRECDGKRMFLHWFAVYSDTVQPLEQRLVHIGPTTDIAALAHEHPWLTTTPLVVKPDQLSKRRGKAGMLLLAADWPTAHDWISARMGKTIEVDHVQGSIDHFLVEPFVPHERTDEYYVAIRSLRTEDEILFHHQGGIDVGDVDANALSLMVPLGETPSPAQIGEQLLGAVAPARRLALAHFIAMLHQCFEELNFTYLEINPLVMSNARLVPLDVAAKLDSAASFESGAKWWGRLPLPAPFGR